MKYKIKLVGFLKWQIVGTEYQVIYDDKTCIYKPFNIPITFDNYWSVKRYLSQL